MHVFFSCLSLPSRERRATACVSVCLSDVVCLCEGLSECACCMLSSPLTHCMRTLLVWLRLWASISFPFPSLASPPTFRCGWHLILRFPTPPVVPSSRSVFPACASLPVRLLRHAYTPPLLSLAHPSAMRYARWCKLASPSPSLAIGLRRLSHVARDAREGRPLFARHCAAALPHQCRCGRRTSLLSL